LAPNPYSHPAGEASPTCRFHGRGLGPRPSTSQVHPEFKPRHEQQPSFSAGRQARCGEVRALNSLRMRDLMVMGVSLVLTVAGASLVQSQGALKGKVLPVLSTSDVIGYITPCG